MIAQKIKVPCEHLIYKYNNKYDVLDVFIGKIQKSISDELMQGVYEHYDIYTDELVGISIENYRSIDKSELNKVLPFNLNYNYINNKIFTDK